MTKEETVLLLHSKLMELVTEKINIDDIVEIDGQLGTVYIDTLTNTYAISIIQIEDTV